MMLQKCDTAVAVIITNILKDEKMFVSEESHHIMSSEIFPVIDFSSEMSWAALVRDTDIDVQLGLTKHSQVSQ